MGSDHETRNLEERKSRSRKLNQERAKVDPIAQMAKNALDLNGNRQMRGDLLLKDDKKPENLPNAAPPTKWVQDELNNKSNSGHGHGWSDLPKDVEKTSHDHDNRYRKLSTSFKRDLSLEDQKRFLGLLHDVEEMPEDRLPEPGEWQSFIRLFKWLARLATDDPEYTADELIQFRENGDPEMLDAWSALYSNEGSIRESLRSRSNGVILNAHFDRQTRRIAEEEDVDIFGELDFHYLAKQPIPVQKAIEKRFKAHERGEDLPIYF